jgi:hypothetical protein
LKRNLAQFSRSVSDFPPQHLLVYDFCALGIPTSPFRLPSTESIPRNLALSSHIIDAIASYNLVLNCAQLTTSLQSVLLEGDATLLLSVESLRFSLQFFFHAFDHTHAGTFLLTIALLHCSSQATTQSLTLDRASCSFQTGLVPFLGFHIYLIPSSISQ